MDAKLRAVSWRRPAPTAETPVASDAKVIELQNVIQQKEAVIKELKSGGVGTANQLPPRIPKP